MTARTIPPTSSVGPPAEMACATCGRVLNTYHRPGGGLAHLHPTRTRGYDHRPVPVPADQLTAVARDCDFCSGPNPILSVRSSPVRTVAVGERTETVHDFGDTWAACITCARLIDTNRADALWRRALDGTPWTRDDIAARAVREIHATVLTTRQPGYTLITTTDWPHTPIPAATLPKVRDAAAKLLHGDTVIPSPFTVPLRNMIADGLDQAHLYAIDDEFTDLAHHAAADLPAGAISGPAALFAPHGLLLWGQPYGPKHISAGSWTTTGDGITATVYRTIGAGLATDALQQMRERLGWLAPVDTCTITGGQIPAARPWVALLTATWLLMTQHAAETVALEPDRRIAKASARTGRPVPEVRVVRIRGRAARPAPVVANPSAAPDSSRSEQRGERRWVSGFWRQQPYGPERSLRRWQYVYAYLRGPQDAPITASTTVRVLRGLPAQPTAHQSTPAQPPEHPDRHHRFAGAGHKTTVEPEIGPGLQSYATH